MEKYSGVVSQDFVNRREEIIKNDKRLGVTRTYQELQQQWDCEWAEQDQASKHEHLRLTEGDKKFIYDIFNIMTSMRQDYKFKAKNGIFISGQTVKRTERNEVDEFVPWDYDKSRWFKEKDTFVYRPLQAGETVSYNVYTPLRARYVINHLHENRFTNFVN